jgi:hypothetical protein
MTRAQAETKAPRVAESSRDWTRAMADKALQKVASQSRVPRRGNREKELFALRANQIKGLFQRIESITQAINKESGSTLITAQRTLSAKNLGGIEVPDGARMVLKFLDRRLELVVNPLQNVGGRPAPIGGLAAASIIQYDASDPTGADWFDVTLREDGWHRKTAEGESAPTALGEKDLRKLLDWLVS